MCENKNELILKTNLIDCLNRFVLYSLFIVNTALGMAQQNLIYNGSFEEYYSCPTGNDLNDGQLEKCKGWWKPTLGTSDYFNACSNGVVSVPTNFWGYQQAFQGDGYVGMGACSWFKSTGEIDDYCEYIQSKMLTPLKPCFEYKFTMHVSLAEYSTYAMKSIGAVFSADPVGNNFDIIIDTIPQVVNKGAFLNDSIEWTKVEGTFIANGTEKYVTIGYFFSTITNDTLFIQNSINSLEDDYSYYYIDSVSLIEIGEVSEELCKIPDIVLPNIITANNDGVNDVFSIEKWLGFEVEVNIFNRWGNKIVTLNENNPVWDGNNCSDGVYFYILTYKKGNKTKQQSGFIQLIR